MKPIVGTLLVILLTAPAAIARPAECATTDDGGYPCDFQPIGRDGSFTIAAPNKPTYTLEVDRPGEAQGFVNHGSRNIPLPGLFLRSRTDPGCWVNDATGVRVCAR